MAIDPVRSTRAFAFVRDGFVAGALVVALCLSLPSSTRADSAVERARAPVAPFRFVVLSHLLPLFDRPAECDALIDSINAANPSLVVILGDSDLSNEAVPRWLRGVLRAEVAFLAGNHDIERAGFIHRYLDAVGYLEKVIVTPQANLVLASSLASGSEFRAALETLLAGLDRGRPTVLFCHHPIWSDARKSETPMSTFASFQFADVRATLIGRVDYIFAGNYVRAEPRTPAPITVATEVDGIVCYTAGMHPDRAAYLLCDVSNGELRVTPRVVRPQEGTAAREQTKAALAKTRDSFLDSLRYAVRFKQFWLGAGAGIGIAALGAGLTVWMSKRTRRRIES